jgi:hypothetical protein
VILPRAFILAPLSSGPQVNGDAHKLHAGAGAELVFELGTIVGDRSRPAAITRRISNSRWLSFDILLAFAPVPRNAIRRVISDSCA